MAITKPPAKPLDFLGVEARILSCTDGLGIVHMRVPAGDASPLHVHLSEDEGFYVIEGEVTLYLPGDRVTLRAGEFFLAPRGVPHAYEAGDEPGEWIVTSTPGGFERFVATVGEQRVTDPAHLAVIASEHDIEILGPPGARP